MLSVSFGFLKLRGIDFQGSCPSLGIDLLANHWKKVQKLAFTFPGKRKRIFLDVIENYSYCY